MKTSHIKNSLKVAQHSQWTSKTKLICTKFHRKKMKKDNGLISGFRFLREIKSSKTEKKLDIEKINLYVRIPISKTYCII